MSFVGITVFESEPSRECWHEAGHAVVAHHLGMKVLAIGLSWVRGERSEPNPSSWIPTDGFDNDRVAVELFGGAAAEILKLSNYDAMALHSDVEAFQELHCSHSPEYYIQQAIDILKEREEALECVHHRLMEERATPSYSRFQDTADHMWKQRHLTQEDFEALMVVPRAKEEKTSTVVDH
jgi:hypothetical protein